MGFLGDLLKGAVKAIPVAGPIASSVLEGLSGSNQRGAEEDNRRLFNEFLQAQGKAGQDVIDAAGGLGALLGPQTSTGNSTSNMSQFTRTHDITDPRFKGYEDTRGRLKGLMDARLAESSAIPQGEALRRVAAVNKAFDPKLGGAAGAMAANSPGGVGAFQLADTQRRSQIADLLGGLESEAYNRRSEQMGQAQQLGEMFRGSESRGTSSTTGTTTGTSSNTNPVGAGQLMAIRDLLAPAGPMASMNTGMSPWLSAAQSGVSGLSQLWADRDNRQRQGAAGPAPSIYGYG